MKETEVFCPKNKKQKTMEKMARNEPHGKGCCLVGFLPESISEI
tara:strand:+ start:18850 stop:18981 length:132 start_codon:yes stop_codon:yes gene_type:complete